MIFYFIGFLIISILLMVGKNRYNRIFIFVLLTLLYGCRNYGGVDDTAYMAAFYNSLIGEKVYGFEMSYILFSKLLGSIGFNYKALFMGYAVISFVFIYLTYNKLCRGRGEWMISILGFCTFAFIPTITIMRQFTAASIVAYALVLSLEKKHKKALFLIIIASIFHKSAMIGVIIYPLCSLNIKKSIKVLLPIICLIIGYMGAFTSVLNKFLLIIPDKYLGYIDRGVTKPDIGLLHILLIGIYLGQYFLDVIKKEKYSIDRKNIMLENLIMIYFCIYFITLSSGWMSRLSIYLIIFLPFLFITLMGRFKSKKDKQILCLICYIAYSALFIYQIDNLRSSTMNNLIPYSGSFNFME